MFVHRSVQDIWGNQKDTLLGLTREEAGRAQQPFFRLGRPGLPLFAVLQDGSCRRSRRGAGQELRPDPHLQNLNYVPGKIFTGRLEELNGCQAAPAPPKACWPSPEFGFPSWQSLAASGDCLTSLRYPCKVFQIYPLNK